MEHLIQENNALRKELKELLSVSINLKDFVEQVRELNEWTHERDDVEYMDFLIESASDKIWRLKSLIDGKQS